MGPDNIPVGSGGGTKAGVKLIRHLPCPDQGDTVRQTAVCPQDPVAAIPFSCGVKMNHLMAGMHPCICAPGTADYQLGIGNRTQGALQFLLHRGAVLLFLKATKSTAVVGDDGSIAIDSAGKAVALWNPAVGAVGPIRF